MTQDDWLVITNPNTSRRVHIWRQGRITDTLESGDQLRIQQTDCVMISGDTAKRVTKVIVDNEFDEPWFQAVSKEPEKPDPARAET